MMHMNRCGVAQLSSTSRTDLRPGNNTQVSGFTGVRGLPGPNNSDLKRRLSTLKKPRSSRYSAPIHMGKLARPARCKQFVRKTVGEKLNLGIS